MPYWQVHFLNARHALTGIMPEVRAAIAEAVARVADHLDLPDFDVVVRAGDGGSDWGVMGAAPAPGVVELTLSPARFAHELTVRRMLRELHHVARWDGPGYGRSLGEVLVSEGLAGHFVVQVLGGVPDPWDAATPPSGLAKRAMTEWAWRDLDRGLWFEGKGNIRKWAGYGLAHRLLAEHLSREPELEAAALVHISAEALRPAMRRLSGAPDSEPESEALPQEPSGETRGEEIVPQPGAEAQAPAEETPGTDALPQGKDSPAASGDEPPPQA
ncbi:DUF2268 domain-containing putative Zn-dependent protease [Paracoccus niistensis]|uniref:DUF2268 domain-containing putative Zn-dependent protease n=1 Tax=Paracoccus niistensis TaxID=632935 RepID=A0ABV6I3Y6_9RHOB